MNRTRPNPGCPGCQGNGEPVTRWDMDKGEIVTEPEPEACSLCFENYEGIYKAAEELNNRYSGKARHLKNMTPEEAEAAWSGEDGQRYRRLLTWLWNRENSPGEPDWKEVKRHTTPFRELFAYERDIRRCGPQPEKKRKLELKTEPVTMEAQLDSKDLTKALKNVMGVIERRCPIPILEDVKLTAERGRILITATNLKDWKEDAIPADVKVEGSICLPARRLFELARLHRSDLYFIGHSDSEAEILTTTGYYIFIGLPVENYPNQRAAA